MKNIAFAIVFILSLFNIYLFVMEDREHDATRAKYVQYKAPTVAQCKEAAKMVSDVAPLLNFDKGSKIGYIKRIFELTDDPQVRIAAQHGAAVLFTVHLASKMNSVNKEVIKEFEEASISSCNTFELK